MNDRNEFRFGEVTGKLVMKLFSFAFMGKLKKYKAIQAKQVAKAMITCMNIEQAGVHILESYKIAEL